MSEKLRRTQKNMSVKTQTRINTENKMQNGIRTSGLSKAMLARQLAALFAEN